MKKLATLAMGFMLSMSVMANDDTNYYLWASEAAATADRAVLEAIAAADAAATATNYDYCSDACLYRKGMEYYELGTQYGYNQALDYFTQSANMGNAEAQINLGYMYSHGYGVRQDYKQAFNWYAKAAAQNNAKAQYNIAGLYYNGWGVRQSYSLAKEWYGKACDNGYQDGCDAYRELNQLGF